jgi:Conserved in the green lineage and diatoms 27
MNPSISPCPVPEEQRPINEYQELKESWFFGWGLVAWGGYLKPLIVLWSLSWLFAGPIAAVSFIPAKQPLQFAIMGAIGAGVVPALALLRLYLGWRYVKTRLLDTTVFYEESGWYDGQVWAKPPEVLAQDRLIVTYQVQPILRRLLITFGVIGGALLTANLVWLAWL